WTDSQLTATNGFSLSQISLTDGYEIQDWTPLGYQQEFERCQRIFYKTFNVDTLPAASVGTNTGEFRFAAMVGLSVVSGGVGFRYPVSQRAAATTLTLFNPGAAGAQIRNITDSADLTASTITANGEQGCHIAGTNSAGGAVGDQLGVHFTADACGANQE